MAKTTYNTSANAGRVFKVLERRPEMGRTRVKIECPFCLSTFWAYVWSISGGGKKCENKACGAIHGSMGAAYPVAGREPEA